ncbi:MAG TPA: hypothetical protein GX506_04175 [Firmicutes bacterium]|nr:hypothetical protein [Bacillota bacterium]
MLYLTEMRFQKRTLHKRICRFLRFLRASILPVPLPERTIFPLRRSPGALIATIFAVILATTTWGSLYVPQALTPLCPDGIHMPYSQVYLDAVPALDGCTQAWAQKPRGQGLSSLASAGISAWRSIYGTRLQEIIPRAEADPYLTKAFSCFLEAHFNQSKYKAPMLSGRHHARTV